MNKTTKRSKAAIVVSLITLVRPMLPIMFCAILMGVAGYFCATFITIFVLFVMGVSSIRDFAAPLMVGIVCGAYTSVCITGALWYVMKHVGKNKYVPSKAVQNKTKNK